MENSKRWEIAICARGIVHIHYGTGSLHIMRDDFLDLASAIQNAAGQLSEPTNEINRKGLMQ